MSADTRVKSVPDSYLSPFKAAHHLEDIHQLRKGLLIPPRNIQVDLEAFCPHSCEFCSYRNVGWQNYEPHPMLFTEPTRISSATSMPWEIAQHIPWQMMQAGIPAIEITGGGESLVYPHIREFFELLGRCEREIGLVTNGVALNRKMRDAMPRSQMQWVRFSCDAATADTYSQVHRTPPSAFETLRRNVSDFCEWRDPATTLVGISFVITQNNYEEIVRAARFWRGAGADSIRYTFTFTPEGDGALSNQQIGDAFGLMDTAYNDYNRPDFKVFRVNRLESYSDPNTDFTQCGYQHFVWAIGFDGKVYPCCIMKYHDGYVIGDLAKQTLQEIVHSDARKKFARDLIVSECKPCYLRDKNKFIEYLLNPKPAHVNFV